MRPSHLALALLALACGAAPSVDPAPPPSGAPADVDAGAGGTDPGAPAAEASLTVERLDADPECDVLVPRSVPAPVVVRLEVPAGAACVGGVSDGTGAVALGVRDPAGAATWRVHAADGTPSGVTFAADAPLLSQPAGWHALEVTRPPFGADPAVDHVAVSPSGDVLRRERVTPDPSVAVGPRWSVSADPAGGSAVAVRSTLVAGNHWSQVLVHRFDAAGAPRWAGGARAMTLDSPRDPAFLAVGVAGAGDLLLLAQHSAFLDAAWLDPDAAAAGGSVMEEEAQAVAGPGLSHVLELSPLLDGTLAVRSDGTWRRSWAPRAGTSAPLPAWLAARATDVLRLAPGGGGYVLVPPSGLAAPDCATRVDLVSRGGRTCGRITIHEAGSACTVRTVEPGRDGTLVAQSAVDACTLRWWPRLLGG